MSDQKVSVLTIQERTVTASQAYPRQKKVNLSMEVEYAPKKLDQAFLKIREALKLSVVRLLLPENKAYLRLISLPSDTKDIHAAVQEDLSHNLPEPIGDLVYDLKTIGKLADEEMVVLVLAAGHNYLKEVKQAADQAGLIIEAIELPSFALSRLTQHLKEPHLIFYLNEPSLVIASYQGFPLEALIFEKDQRLDQMVDNLIFYIKRKYKLSVEALVVDEGQASFVRRSELKIKVKEMPLVPALGLALKEDLRGKDEEVLNLELPRGELLLHKHVWTSRSAQASGSEGTEEEEALFDLTSPTSAPQESRLKKLRTPFTVGLVLLILGVSTKLLLEQTAFGNFPFFSPAALPTPTPRLHDITPTQAELTPSPVLTATPTPLDKTLIKIRVLNGNGVVGTAALARSFLTARGYTVIDTANAQRYNYAQTEVHIKPSKKDYLNLLTEDLKDQYETATFTDMAEDAALDVDVIIGHK